MFTCELGERITSQLLEFTEHSLVSSSGNLEQLPVSFASLFNQVFLAVALRMAFILCLGSFALFSVIYQSVFK